MKIPFQRLRRRAFLRSSLGVLAAAHPGVVVLAGVGEKSTRSSPLKPESQYRAEALAYEVAMESLARLPRMPVNTQPQLQQASILVDQAAPDLDGYFSWMVMAFVSSPDFVVGVRRRVQDKATFKALVRDLLRDPNVVMSIPGASLVRSRFGSQARLQMQRLTDSHQRIEDMIGAMDAGVAEIRKTAEKMEVTSNKVREASQQIEEAKKKVEAQRDAACAQVAAAMVATLIVVVSVIIASSTSGGAGDDPGQAVAFDAGVLSESDVHQAATDLADAYEDDGGAAMRRCLDDTNERYRSRIKSIPKTMNALERQREVLRHQAMWLSEKADCSGSAADGSVG